MLYSQETKNKFVLLIPSEVSLFTEELLKDNNYLVTKNNDVLKTTNCPYCITGKLLIRTNPTNNNQFLGCSHFPQCNQTFKHLEIIENSLLCHNCESGYMVKRNGTYGNFLGCTNYPKCSNTIKL